MNTLTLFTATMLLLSSGMYFSLNITDMKNRYNHLKPLTIVLMVWSFLMVLSSTATGNFSYYLHLLNFPLTFILLYFSVQTALALDKKTYKKEIKIGSLIWITILISFVFTNSFHHWFLKLSSNSASNFYNAEYGWFFYLHSMVSYIFLFYFLALMLIKIKNKDKNIKHRLMSIYYIIGIAFLGVALNLINNYFYRFEININFFIFFFFVLSIYHAIYTKDVHFEIVNKGRNKILEEMREMYILYDDSGEILEISQPLKNKFALTDENSTIDVVLEYIKKYTVIYHDISELKNVKLKSKPYFYTEQKEINLQNHKKNGYLVLFYDETEVLKMIDELNYLRKFDIMTDLYNRNHFEESKNFLQKKHPYSGVITADIDNLKKTNDRYGHQKGDELITRFAFILKRLIKENNGMEVFRMGGDEFLIFIYNINENPLYKVVNKINKISKDVDEKISFSIGTSQEKNTIEEMIRCADKEMYKEKSQKKESV